MAQKCYSLKSQEEVKGNTECENNEVRRIDRQESQFGGYKGDLGSLV